MSHEYFIHDTDQGPLVVRRDEHGHELVWEVPADDAEAQRRVEHWQRQEREGGIANA